MPQEHVQPDDAPAQDQEHNWWRELSEAEQEQLLDELMRELFVLRVPRRFFAVCAGVSTLVLFIFHFVIVLQPLVATLLALGVGAVVWFFGFLKSSRDPFWFTGIEPPADEESHDSETIGEC